ncbi:MAG: rhodanese-like domain-containing protein [Halobacteriota archaeon]
MDGEISTETVRALLEADDGPRIVDIRSPAAFERGHIPGSVNIPFAELPQRVDSLSDADHIVTVCPHGQASVQAARLIKSYAGTADADVESMRGGLSAWSGELESDANSKPVGDGPETPF